MNVKGPNIVVLDRGCVYYGLVAIDGDNVVIENAYNIRVWGTTEGLGQLALQGPQKATVLDSCGVVIANLRSVNHFLKTDGARWPTGK
jgi:hypothetical protein